MEPKLHLHFFGTPQFTYGDKPVTGFISNKVRTLLIYLAVTGRTHSRGALAELLWADTPTTARINLRKALSNLRNLAGVNLLEPSADMVALDRQQCWIDVVAFAQGATSVTPEMTYLRQIAQLYQADFLAGFNTSLSYEFEAWALGEQTRLKRQMITLLDRLAMAHEAANALDQAIATARRLLTMEPRHEQAHRQLMRLLARSGDRSAALAQFQECVTTLKAELAVDPAAETLALFDQIRAGTYSPPQSTSTIPAREVVSSTPPIPAFNVPIPATPLVGRQPLLVEIAQLIQRDEVRLVTLTGPGGVGKTRLALHMGHNVTAQFPDGVVFVELAPLRAAHLVPVAIADALDIRESAGNRPLLAHISNHLHEKALLLIVDNFEHLIEGAPVISELLAGAPQLKVLVTSREVLHIRGEFAFVVPPLHLPRQQPRQGQTKLDEIESIQLFIQQAQRVRPDFACDAVTLQQVADICIRLDGLPLAIELAAARTKMLDVKSIIARLDERFVFLQRGPKDAPLRHQTLQNAIDWSYALLTTAEQTLLCQLSVFVGGCTLEAIEAIWVSQPGSAHALDLLTSLVDKSLLVRQPQEDSPLRFTQLESILAYGRQKLSETGGLDATEAAHAHYFLRLAEAAEPMLFGVDQVRWLAQLGAEQDNLRAGLQWLIERGEAVLAARLGSALWHFWYVRSHHLEGTVWLEQILVLQPDTMERGKLLYGLGMLARRTGNNEIVAQYLAEALYLFQQVEEEYYIASSLRVLGFIDYRLHNHDAAQQKLEEALRLFRGLDNREGVAVTLTNLGYIHIARPNYAAAKHYFDESLAIRRQTGNQHGVANCLDALGLITLRQHNYLLAQSLLIESRAIYEALGNPVAAERSVHFLGAIAYNAGAYVDADAYFAQAYAYAEQGSNPELLSENQFGLALTRLQLGDARDASLQILNALRYFSQTNDMDKIVVCLASFSLIALTMQRIRRGIIVAAKVMQTLELARTHVLIEILVDQVENAVSTVCTEGGHDISQFWAEGEAMALEDVISFVLDMPLSAE